MPLKLSVGLSQKLGMPNYGSLGASCHVEVELDAQILQQDSDRFHCHVRNAFDACRQAVIEELTRSRASNHPNDLEDDESQDGSQNNENQGSPGSHDRGVATNGSRAASERQLDYVRQLCAPILGLGHSKLESLTQQLFSKSMYELSRLEASKLIDTVKAIRDGKFDLDALLNQQAA